VTARPSGGVSRYPDRYREVSVADVEVELATEPLRALLTSRPAYRRTRYVVVRNGGQAALVELVTRPAEGLFVDVDDAVVLSGAEETAYLCRPELDTAVPSQVASARADAPGARCVVVEGRYGHVSFVLDPRPIRVHVLDVAPPWPAKLVDQMGRVLETADDLPPVQLVPEVIDLHDLLPSDLEDRAGHYLLQCRGGGMDVAGAAVSYLDEVPARQDWTLVGCARSRQIHDFLYRAEVEQIDTCPRALAERQVRCAAGEYLLTKCCLLEEHVEAKEQTIVVPWGASFGHLREAMRLVASAAADPAGKAVGPR
jgi:hypothetical protein